MTERPILFSGAMVRAILDGSKTQTRRVLRDQQPVDLGAGMHGAHLSRRPVHDHGKLVGHRLSPVICPYGAPGDRLWVRENGCERIGASGTFEPYYYDADFGGPSDIPNGIRRSSKFKRRPSIHMPRWACRLVLDVIGVRVERLQDIKAADAIAEGWDRNDPESFDAKDWYRLLWNSLNAKRGLGWNLNPWVWVVEFKRHVDSPPGDARSVADAMSQGGSDF